METQKLFVDDGFIRFEINDNGVLKFNPSDFNVYERFYALIKELPEIEKKYVADVEATATIGEMTDTDLVGRELIRAREIDKAVKNKLSAVFGVGNDFDQLLGGVNVFAVARNGERVITNLLNALYPYVEDGIKKLTDSEVVAAKLNREQRRAAQKGVSAL